MRQMTRIEKIMFELSWVIRKFHMRLGKALGFLITETSDFEGGTRTIYKNKKGKTLYEYREF